MPRIIWEFIRDLLQAVRDRLKEIYHKLKLSHLSLIIIVLATTAWASAKPDQALAFAARVITMSRIVYADVVDDEALPIDAEHRETLRKHTKLIHDQLSAFIYADKARSGVVNAWVLGQVMTALQDDDLYAADWPRAYFESTMNPDTNTWQEVFTGGCIQDLRAIHYPSTYWSTYALHNAGYDVSKQIEVIVNAQNSQWGYWTAYGIGEHVDKNASTYSTVLAALLLHYASQNSHVSDELAARARASIKKAVHWLGTRAQTENRWLVLDYPHNDAESSTSIAASAMVVHLFNLVDDELAENLDVSGISADFLDSLGAEIYTPMKKEVPGAMIFDDQDRPILKDAARYYILPWMLIAVRDAYEHGDIASKRRAIEFVEMHVDQTGDGVRLGPGRGLRSSVNAFPPSNEPQTGYPRSRPARSPSGRPASGPVRRAWRGCSRRGS